MNISPTKTADVRNTLRVILMTAILTLGIASTVTAAEATAPRHRFGDMYVAGMATLFPGGGTLEPPGGTPRIMAKSLRSELLIPSGSLIITGSDETARIRLGERSLLRVNPGSAIRIFTLHLELERGNVAIQHGKSLFPLRLQAASTALLLDHDSAADFVLPGDGNLVVTVQGGSARLQGTDDALTAGRRAIVEKGRLVTDPPIAKLMAWGEYLGSSQIHEYTPSLGLDIESDEDGADDPLTPNLPPPGTGQQGNDPAPTPDHQTPVNPSTAPDDILRQHDVEGGGVE
ncbi:MAG TPA: hypothetical protein PLP29_18845 [Candidatus Ozemobacteraceae bacterium]|nr:hypothetical protein [Candidatus Ozemobacteraceae bacterium]